MKYKEEGEIHFLGYLVWSILLLALFFSLYYPYMEYYIYRFVTKKSEILDEFAFNPHHTSKIYTIKFLLFKKSNHCKLNLDPPIMLHHAYVGLD